LLCDENEIKQGLSHAKADCGKKDSQLARYLSQSPLLSGGNYS